MKEGGKLIAGLKSYGIALLAVGLAIALRLALDPVLGDRVPFVTLFVAVLVAARYGGWRAGLFAIAAGAVGCAYFLLAPRYSFAIAWDEYRYALLLFVLVSLILVYLVNSLERERKSCEEKSEQLRTTLASIGDAVITTDAEGRVRSLNGVAETLTGWSSDEAEGRDVGEVFQVIDEDTRQPVESPVQRALREGRVIGLDNHAVLIAREGRERAIDDTAAPIRAKDGGIIGAVLVFRDVQAQREATRAQQHTLATLERLVSSAPLGIAIMDAELRYLHVNRVLAEMNGMSVEDHLGRRLRDVLPGLADEIEPLARRVLETKLTVSDHLMEGATRRDPGVSHSWRVSWFPIADGNAPAHGVGVIVQDVSIQRRIEDELAALAQRQTWLIDNSPLAVIEWGGDFRVTRWSDVAEKLFGRPATEVLGVRIDALNMIHPEDVPKVEQTMARLRDPRNRFVVSRNRNLTPSGEVLSCEWYNSVLHDEQGRIVAVLSLVLDVTERVNNAARLEESEARFRTLADNIAQLAWMAGDDAEIDWFNQRWLAYTGSRLEDNLDGGWKRFLHPQHQGAVVDKLERCLREGRDWEDTFLLRGADGHYRWFLSRMTVIHKEAGDVVRFFGTCTDVTEGRQTAEALQRLTEELSEADRRKDEFLATLAHELRNPLAPLRNGLEVLKRLPADSSVAHQARSTMERQIAHMVRLIDDLLDVSRITRNRLELKHETVDLGHVVRQAVEACSPQLAQAGHHLDVILPAQTVELHADPVRLVQIFSNILANACKYTEPEGRIELRVEADATEARVAIRDSGIGIPPEMQARVFDLFTQVDQSLKRSAGGLGIGLSLVKRLVELHGGRVEVRSDGIGHGSEFTVHLPRTLRAPVEQAALPRERPLELAGRRILIVEDNQDSADSLAVLLGLAGSSVRTANDGASGIREAADFAPEVILLDIGLPDIDGFETCRAIRRQPGGEAIRIVALSGWGQEDDKRASAEAGFDGYLVKPVDVGALTRLLNQEAFRT